MSEWHTALAARVVSNGGVIAYPTEAVFGLGCDPMNGASVNRILRMKRRPLSKGLIVIAAGVGEIESIISFPTPSIRERVMASWPGPVTWILPARAGVPQWLKGRSQSLAVRVTAHPVAAAIARKVGLLVSTSANPSGLQPARSADRVRAYFSISVDCVVPGSVGPQRAPTEIRDAVTGEIVRDGVAPGVPQ